MKIVLLAMSALVAGAHAVSLVPTQSNILAGVCVEQQADFPMNVDQFDYDSSLFVMNRNSSEAKTKPDLKRDYVYMLSRATIACRTRGIQSFKLVQNASNTAELYYTVTCCDIPLAADKPDDVLYNFLSTEPVFISRQNKSDTTTESILDLDKFNVTCPLPNYHLSTYALELQSAPLPPGNYFDPSEAYASADETKHKMYYRYLCTLARRSFGKCTTRQTKATVLPPDGDFRALTNQSPSCNEDEVMTGIRFVRPASNTFAYDVDCCVF